MNQDGKLERKENEHQKYKKEPGEGRRQHGHRTNSTCFLYIG